MAPSSSCSSKNAPLTPTSIAPTSEANHLRVLSTGSRTLHIPSVSYSNSCPSPQLYFSSAQIWEQFIPLCFQLLEVGAAPVRAAAAAAAASLMRHNKRAAQRADIAQRLVRDFAEGASAAQRILFLDFCAAVRKVASTRLFRDYFLHAAVDLLMVRTGRSRASVLSGHQALFPSPFRVIISLRQFGSWAIWRSLLIWCCQPPFERLKAPDLWDLLFNSTL